MVRPLVDREAAAVPARDSSFSQNRAISGRAEANSAETALLVVGITPRVWLAILGEVH